MMQKLLPTRQAVRHHALANDAFLSRLAASRGHVKVLRWFSKSGVSWVVHCEDVYWAAANSGQVVAMSYIVDELRVHISFTKSCWWRLHVLLRLGHVDSLRVVLPQFEAAGYAFHGIPLLGFILLCGQWL